MLCFATIINFMLLGVLYTKISIRYCILGNFRGTKFSRLGPSCEYIFEDGHLVIIDNNSTSIFRVVKISRLQANL